MDAQSTLLGDDSRGNSAFVQVVLAALGSEGGLPAGESDSQNDGSLVAAAIARQVGASVEAFLNTAPPIPSSVLSGVNSVRMDHYLCRCIGVSTESQGDGVLGSAIRRELSGLSREFFYKHPTIIERMQRAEADKAARSLDEVQKLIVETRRVLSLSELQVSEALKGGLSGSVVVRVYYREPQRQTELGVLKCTDSKDDYDREIFGQAAARQSWMRDWVEPNLKQAALFSDSQKSPNTEWYSLLSPLAFPPSQNRQIIPSLYDLVRERHETERCKKVVEVLGTAYAKNFENLTPDGDDYLTAEQLFHKTLKHWDKPCRDKVWDDGAFWNLARLPFPTTQCFRDGNQVLWNPLWLLHQKSLGSEARLEGRFSDQHGDLNARNVMMPVLADDNGGPHSNLRLIDFEKWARQSAVLDICWLSFSILDASAPARPTVDYWSELPHRFVKMILGGDRRREGDSGHFQLALDLVDRLFSPLHEMAGRVGGAMPNTTTSMLITTLASAGLAFSYYAIRSLDSDIEVISRMDERRKRLLAAQFGFRVAAWSLNYLDMPLASGHAYVNTIDELARVFED